MGFDLYFGLFGVINGVYDWFDFEYVILVLEVFDDCFLGVKLVYVDVFVGVFVY